MKLIFLASLLDDHVSPRDFSIYTNTFFPQYYAAYMYKHLTFQFVLLELL